MRALDYDRVAKSYDNDWAGLYGTARNVAVDQIAMRCKYFDHGLDTLDLGIGTGNAIQDLGRRIRLGKCTGLDLSPGMLARSRAKLAGRVELIRGDALDAGEHLAFESQNLVLCHFLLGFVDGRRLLETAFDLLRPGGLLSVATTTSRSMGELYSGRFEQIGRWLGVRKSIDRLSNPTSHSACCRMLEARGYEVIESRALQQAIRFDCYDDVQAWAIDSGWLVNGQDRHIGWRIAGGRALLRAGEIFLHPLYPIHATSEMSIVLAQKPLECESAFAPRSGYIVNSPAESGRNPELDPVAWPDSVTALPETARTSAQSG